MVRKIPGFANRGSSGTSPGSQEGVFRPSVVLGRRFEEFQRVSAFGVPLIDPPAGPGYRPGLLFECGPVRLVPGVVFPVRSVC